MHSSHMWLPPGAMLGTLGVAQQAWCTAPPWRGSGSSSPRCTSRERWRLPVTVVCPTEQCCLAWQCSSAAVVHENMVARAQGQWQAYTHHLNDTASPMFFYIQEAIIDKKFHFVTNYPLQALLYIANWTTSTLRTYIEYFYGFIWQVL